MSIRRTAIALHGGLDLTTPAPLARNGTLSDCLNYEVANRRGYTRVDGFERFDGRPGVAEYRILRLTLANVVGQFNVRARVRFVVGAQPLPHQGVDGFVTSAEAVTGGLILGVAFAGGMADPSLPDTLTTVVGGSTATASAFESLEQPIGQQADFDFALRELATARRAQITAVPGRGGSEVLGGFVLRNQVYAIRDLPRAFFEGGYYTDADEGLFVEVDGQRHQILEARVLGPLSGFVAYDPIPGSPTAPLAPGVGTPTLTTLPVTGSLPGGFVGIPYAAGLEATGGSPPYSWSMAGDATSPPSPPQPGDLSEIVFQSEVTPAALWRATANGWVRVAAGREMAFSAGTAGLRSPPRSQDPGVAEVRNTGWVFPTQSTINGVAEPNLNDDDGVTAALSDADGQTILCRGFSFPGLPDGAQIVGIEARIERQSNAGAVATDGVVALAGISGGVDNKAGGPWPVALTAATYGGETDLWGSETITVDTVRGAAFGVLAVVRRADPAQAIIATIDHVAVRVHYVERGGRPAWVWDGATDVPITIINVQALEGDAGQSSARGHLTIEAAANSAKSRLIRSGDQIRSAPAGGGDLLGLVASRDRPVFLPGQFEVDNNRSQYQVLVANFFGQDRFSAAYGVSGAGPAFAFDGRHIIKVRAPLSPGEDIPRHIAKHGSCLMLGYYSGALLHSAVGQPYETRGAFGAGSIETGDRLTALTPGGGDALVVVCESSTFVLRGLSPTSYTLQTVSARRGAIEYTLADPGTAIIADSFGLFAAETPESFQPAARRYLSTPVEPWLRERLQATISNEQRFLRPVAAMAVRSKNQYRLYFRDGAVLTLTSTEEGVEITRQRLGTAAGLAIRSVWSGIDASGRERLFASFLGAKQGLVFELDAGRSFDGEPIRAVASLNPFNAGAQSQLKKFDRFFVSGAAGVASLAVTAGANGQAAGGEPAALVIGGAGQPATSPNGSRRNSKHGAFHMGREAYDLSLRFESLTDIEAPHTLQYIEPYLDGLGDSRGETGA